MSETGIYFLISSITSANLFENMEVLDNLEAKLATEHRARVASSLDNINQMKKQIQDDKAVVTKATILSVQISDLENKVAVLKTSKDYVSPELMKELKMAIEIREALVDNLILVHEQIQLTQTNPAFMKGLKEEILVIN